MTKPFISYTITVLIGTIQLIRLIQLNSTITNDNINNLRKENPVIVIDYRDRRPIYEQIVERFQELILKDILEPDNQLPSVRNLAMELSINPNTIQRAYAQLEQQGYIYSVQGKGSFVSENDSLVLKKKEEILDEASKLAKIAKEYGIKKNKFISVIAGEFGEES